MSTSTIWHHESSNELFSVTMSHSRFKFISCFITSDDKGSRTEHWKTDKFACMRELFRLMSVSNAKCTYPSLVLSVDETLQPYCGAICFKQYNPNKSAKYGLLIRGARDLTTTHTHYILQYASKPKVAQGDSAKYYVTGTDAYTSLQSTITVTSKVEIFCLTGILLPCLWQNGLFTKSSQLLLP